MSDFWILILLRKENASNQEVLATLDAMGIPGQRAKAVLKAVAEHADESWTITISFSNHGCKVRVGIYCPYPENQLGEYEFPFRGTIGEQSGVLEEIGRRCVELFGKIRESLGAQQSLALQ